MSTTPEALRLAELLGTNFWEGKQGREVWDLAAAELRRLAQVEQYAETLNARCIEDAAELGRKSDAIQRLWAERDQLREVIADKNAAIDLMRQAADQLRAEVEALRADAPQWRPIETAPKDGTNVLLVNRKGNMAAGLWMDSLSGSGWYLRGGSLRPDTFFNDHHGPTHWMPLPAAPAS